jgi:hypothetical protein
MRLASRAALAIVADDAGPAALRFDNLVVDVVK